MGRIAARAPALRTRRTRNAHAGVPAPGKPRLEPGVTEAEVEGANATGGVAFVSHCRIALAAKGLLSSGHLQSDL